MNYKTTPQFIRHLRNGEPAAYYQLIERYSVQIIDFLTTVLRSKEDAEEIAQDIFIHVWKKRDKLVFEKVEHIKGYIFTIARTRAIDRINERKRSKILYTDQLTASAGHADPPDEIIETKQLEKRLDNAISSMPRMRRTIYRMRYVHGKTNEEIAAELNLKSSTVRAHISIALKELKDFIGLMCILF